MPAARPPPAPPARGAPRGGRLPASRLVSPRACEAPAGVLERGLLRGRASGPLGARDPRPRLHVVHLRVVGGLESIGNNLDREALELQSPPGVFLRLQAAGPFSIGAPTRLPHSVQLP